MRIDLVLGRSGIPQRERRCPRGRGRGVQNNCVLFL
jgi:hypothetical protein